MTEEEESPGEKMVGRQGEEKSMWGSEHGKGWWKGLGVCGKMGGEPQTEKGEEPVTLALAQIK